MGEVKNNAPSQGVTQFHENDDTDQNYEAHHHTLGMKYGQALPGDLFKKMLDNGELGGEGEPGPEGPAGPAGPAGPQGDSFFTYNDHGAVAGTARIVGFLNIWRGSVYPTNADASIDMIVWTG